MAIKFKVVDMQLEIDEKTLMVSEFRAFVLADKAKDKKTAKQHLLFIFFMCEISPDNPYRDWDESEKMQEVLTEVYGSAKYKHDKATIEMVNAAFLKYNKLNANSVWRSVKTLDSEIDSIEEILQQLRAGTVKPADKKGAQASLVDLDVIKKRQDIALGIEKLTKSRQNQLKVAMMEDESGTNRANLETSPLEEGSFDFFKQAAR